MTGSHDPGRYLRSTAVTVDRLEAFCAVVDCGSFSQAAARLGLSQPAVSMHIRTLETYCHAPLLARSGGRVTLTAPGEALYREARLLLQQFHAVGQVANEMRQGWCGTFRLGASRGLASAELVGLLGKLRAAYPDTEIETRWGGSLGVLRDFFDHQLDAAFVLQECLPETAGWWTCVARQPDSVVAVGADGSGFSPEAASLAELLRSSTYVRHSGDCWLQRRVEERWPDLRGCGHALLLGDANEVREAVCQGLGFAFLLLSSVRKQVQQGTLRVAPIDGFPMAVNLALVSRRASNSSVLGTLATLLSAGSPLEQAGADQQPRL
jgi:DNA-binding transcriptional LysR family regulator